MKNRALKTAAAAVLVLAALYFLPLVVTEAGGPDGRVWHVPVFSSVLSGEKHLRREHPLLRGFRWAAVPDRE